MERRLLSVFSVLAALAISGCPPPRIRSLNPSAGQPRTLVEVDGDTFLSTARWDAGAPGEQTLAGGFLGASLFTVPGSANQGPHPVQLERAGKRGNTEPFTVTPQLPFGAPRLDRVSVLSAQFQGNQVNTWLYVQGANVDTSAEVLVDGAVVPTVAHKGIQNDLLGINAVDLGYPIYHHLALLAAPGPRAPGSVLTVQIRNSDGLGSNTRQYAMPTDAATLDSDGDDLPDAWEKGGYDADGDGIVDVDLPALGADPLRPDIFVEVDVMNGLANTPGAQVWNALRGAFANAPIINPVTDGVNLVLDTGGTVAFSQRVSLTAADNAATGTTNFYTLKNANFDNAARGRIYHYCLWSNAQPGGYSGISDVDLNAANTDFAGPGDDFIVSFDDFPAAYQTARSMAETFMHELGHGLQQRHGGVTHYQYNSTYSSVMSYSWQLRTGANNATRLARPVYSPLYYGMNAAVEIAGAVPAGVTSIAPDYSQGMGRNLVENALDEPTGLYNGNAVDWNGDGDSTDAAASRDLTGDGDTNDSAVDFSNWSNLVFAGPRLNGEYGN